MVSNIWRTLFGRRKFKILRSTIERGSSGQKFRDEVPKWLWNVSFLGYAEMGWIAMLNGKTVATGEWGDYIYELPNGFGCTQYPKGLNSI